MPPKDKKDTAAPSYKALVGISYDAGRGQRKRVQPGAVTSDLPQRVVEVLLKQGAIEEVK